MMPRLSYILCFVCMALANPVCAQILMPDTPADTNTAKVSISKQQAIEADLTTDKSTKLDTIALVDTVAKDQAAFESSIGIDGLVIDNTFTKAGRDFYELFYSGWQPPENASGYTIFVKELPGRGRTTGLEFKINDEVIFEGNLQPRYDYLEGLAEYIQRRAYQYLLNYEEIKERMANEDMKGSGIY